MRILDWFGIKRPDVKSIELGDISDFTDRKALGSFACCSFLLVGLVIYPLLATVALLHTFTDFYKIGDGYWFWFVDVAVFAFLLLITITFGPVRHFFPMNLILFLVLITDVVLIYIKLLLVFGNVVWGGAMMGITGLMTFSAYTYYFECMKFKFPIAVLLSIGISSGIGGLCFLLFDIMPMLIVGGIVQCSNLYILLDIYLISTGKHYYNIKPREYIVGAFHLLFIDVFTCFIYLKNIP